MCVQLLVFGALKVSKQNVKPLGAGLHSWCIQCFSSLSLKLRARMNSRILMLKTFKLNLCAMVFLVRPTYFF